MAELTIVACGNVCVALSGCRAAIVATGAIAGHVLVIKTGCGPVDGIVAGAALLVCRYVRARLSGGRASVMTAGTAAGHLVVIDPADRRPALNTVTGFTAVAGCHMVGVLAGGPHTIVTACTVAGHPGMVEAADAPVGSAVTG